MHEEKEVGSPEALTGSAILRQLSDDIDRHYACSPPHISAAPSVATLSDQTDRHDNEDDDFEFAFVPQDLDTGLSITADEIFSNGQIRPVYPIFNRDLLLDGVKTLRQPLRRLLIEERETSILALASSDDELEGISPETYCVWNPRSPEQCHKSVSTGSSIRWRIRDLMIGRSQSDGKEKFVFLETNEKKGKGKEETKVDIVRTNRINDDWIGRGTTTKGRGGGRKSFLPYKPGIVGFFAGVNGISRIHHPF